MENNKKTRFKINAFDIFLILLAVCLVATFGLKIYQGISEDKNSYNSEYILSFVCEGEYNSVIRSVREGDTVYLENGEILGYIAPPEKNGTTPLEIISNTEGSSKKPFGSTEILFVSFSGKLKLNGNAKLVENGDYYLLGDSNITEGATLTVHTVNAEFTIKVSSIEKVDKY